jgi:hypothetical protein
VVEARQKPIFCIKTSIVQRQSATRSYGFRSDSGVVASIRRRLARGFQVRPIFAKQLLAKNRAAC